MAKKRHRLEPFETEITAIDGRGLGLGRTPTDQPVAVRFASPGSRVHVTPQKKARGQWSGRLSHVVRPPPNAVTPPCPRMGLCGGCSLFDLNLATQRTFKAKAALEEIGPCPVVHAVRGTPQSYRYRNKLELAFGPRRYLSEEAMRRREPLDGRFLGFHAPGRFDRIVDVDPDDGGCFLGSQAMMDALRTLRAHTLHAEASPPYNPHTNEGGWRHVVLRKGSATGELLVILHTTSHVSEAEVCAVVSALEQTPLTQAALAGVVWRIYDGVADIAGGDTARVWGADAITERLLDRAFKIGPDTFFQTHTEAAEILYTTIGEALGEGGTLLDLYCGSGSIGITLASGFDAVVGVEVVPGAIADARHNAEVNHVQGRWITGAVEDALDVLTQVEGPRRIVVDPPRAGLHPRAAQALAQAQADALIYVACKPSSLGRDRLVLEAGGWTLTSLWTVDLFPQTGHIEAVARFERVRDA